MSRARLTERDRRQIAAGLTQGLGYAEIARRMHRPTSAVSREVNHNGGHTGYRPQEAHRAAIARAARGRAGTREAQVAPEPVGGGLGPDPAGVGAFEHRYCQTLIETGFPPMMARILVCLQLSESGILTTDELVDRLGVSPASISKAIAYLERLRLVRRETDSRTRRQRYIIDADVWDIVWRDQARSMSQWAAIITEGAHLFGPATATRARLDRLSRFLTFHHHEMLDSTKRWQQQRNQPQSALAADKQESRDEPAGHGLLEDH